MGDGIGLERRVLPKAAALSLPSACIAFICQWLHQFRSVNDPLEIVYQPWITFTWSVLAIVLSILLSLRVIKASARFDKGLKLLRRLREDWADASAGLVAAAAASQNAIFSKSDSNLKTSLSSSVRFRHTLVRLVSLLHGTALTELQGTGNVFDALGGDCFDEETIQFLSLCDAKRKRRVEVLLQWLRMLVADGVIQGVLAVPAPLLTCSTDLLSRGMETYRAAKELKEEPLILHSAQVVRVVILSLAATQCLLTPLFANCLMESVAAVVFISFAPIFVMWSVLLFSNESHWFLCSHDGCHLATSQREFNDSLMALLESPAQRAPCLGHSVLSSSVEELLHACQADDGKDYPSRILATGSWHNDVVHAAPLPSLANADGKEIDVRTTAILECPITMFPTVVSESEPPREASEPEPTPDIRSQHSKQAPTDSCDTRSQNSKQTPTDSCDTAESSTSWWYAFSPRSDLESAPDLGKGLSLELEDSVQYEPAPRLPPLLPQERLVGDSEDVFPPTPVQGIQRVHERLAIPQQEKQTSALASMIQRTTNSRPPSLPMEGSPSLTPPLAKPSPGALMKAASSKALCWWNASLLDAPCDLPDVPKATLLKSAASGEPYVLDKEGARGVVGEALEQICRDEANSSSLFGERFEVERGANDKHANSKQPMRASPSVVVPKLRPSPPPPLSPGSQRL